MLISEGGNHRNNFLKESGKKTLINKRGGGGGVLNGIACSPHPRPCKLKVDTLSSKNVEWKG